MGSFESDALLVPPMCRFEHMHHSSECQSHDEWRKRASDKCSSETMTLKDYGVLIPCGTGMFTGVEFVCCPPDSEEHATEAVKVMAVSEAPRSPKPTSVLEHLKSEISKFAKHVEASSVGMSMEHLFFALVLSGQYQLFSHTVVEWHPSMFTVFLLI